ncbi:hypothetical protein CLOBOL_07093, partial [Enterocloster bolteae ATCC BAA-613]
DIGHVILYPEIPLFSGFYFISYQAKSGISGENPSGGLPVPTAAPCELQTSLDAASFVSNLNPLLTTNVPVA